MLPILTDYLERLQNLHTQMQQAIAGLPPAALNWTPGPEMNSLAVLVVHTAGSQRYWIGEVAGRDPANRDREAEFRVQGWDEANLLELLAASLAHSQATLARLTLPDLEGQRLALDGREVTVAWVLWHALGHTALHTGQMQLTRQLWEQASGQQS
jgi:uncharacterized damage-inducible protein DinB